MSRSVFLAVFVSLALQAMAGETVVKFGRFDNVTVYRNTAHPSSMVLFVSGEGGWNTAVRALAQELGSLDALVVGIDLPRYLKRVEGSKDKCAYPASDFEELSQFIQKESGLESYIPPVLVGYGRGATWVYGILAQSPPNAFKGAISLGFCPELPLSKPLCRGQGLEIEPLSQTKGYRLLPAHYLESPWIAFQPGLCNRREHRDEEAGVFFDEKRESVAVSTVERFEEKKVPDSSSNAVSYCKIWVQGLTETACDTKTAEAYVKNVPLGDIVIVPPSAPGVSTEKRGTFQFRETFKRMVAKGDPTPASFIQSIKGLPLIEVTPAQPEKDYFAVVLSGDGGWAEIDRVIAKSLGEKGIPVVGFNSLKYFWKKRSPEEASKDLERILRHYFSAWGKKKAVLVGYSRGADVLPFMANRLSKDMLEKIRLVALLGLEPSVEFEIHPGDFFNSTSKNAQPIRPELEKLRGLQILCFNGEDEKDSLCRDLPRDLAEVIQMKGGHHFGGDYREIAHEILRRLE